MTNSQILFLLALLIIICLFSTIAGEIWNYQNKVAHWYLGLTRLTDDKTASKYLFKTNMYN